VGQCQNHELKETLLECYQVPEELIGIEGVSLHTAVVEVKCVRCGYLHSILIPNLQGLIAAVAVARSLMPLKMRGHEVRFMREALDLTAMELATPIAIGATQISRIENDAEPIGPRSEKLLRLFVLDNLARQTAIKVNRNAIFQMKIRESRQTRESLKMDFWLSQKHAAAPRPRKLGPKWGNSSAAA
jgi:hypothetical protein